MCHTYTQYSAYYVMTSYVTHIRQTLNGIPTRIENAAAVNYPIFSLP